MAGLNVLAKIELQERMLATDINQTLPFTQTLIKTGIADLLEQKDEPIHITDIEKVVKKASNKNYTKFLGKRGKQPPVQCLNSFLKKCGYKIKKLINKGRECLDYRVEDIFANFDWFSAGIKI